MKLLVTSIKFTKDGRNLQGQKDGSRSVTVTLNNGRIITIDLDGSITRYLTQDGRKMTETERLLAALVFSACVSWLIENPEESMSYAEVAAADCLAENRIDWRAAGYPEEGEPMERALTLGDHISHYIDF